MDITEDIELWFKIAKPNPSIADIRTQIGCHFEEVAEFVDAIREKQYNNPELAKMYKSKEVDWDDVTFTGVDILDALCDQIVTAIGIGYMLGMDVPKALKEVSASNWSKFDESGNPILDPETGKILKGKDYFKPELEQFVGVRS